MGLTMKVRCREKKAIAKVIGRVIGADSEKFAKNLESAYAKGDQIILDLSETDFLDSRGLGTIVYYFHRMQQEGRDFVILNANANPYGYLKRLFEVTKLDQVLKIVDSMESL
jgi:anti-anti-sigma factor